ncbi:YceI family protein [Chitinophaga nivalis]|uniref:YceI family protein n=1 Tax=Chitinophaga nivalis TaxID=2991709 RepID=A0ABT3ITD4_9BACT|nr:YceI family protein [Chitinophaga nivalis]MCW3463061.1 YceI family protein [Chitinophaga nivalis]MCW3487249.1 YceI family protein [Chitinophaga nivalis]
MKKNLLFTALLLLAGITTFAQVKWNADPAHTNVIFSVKHLGINYIQGHFTKYNISVETADTVNFHQAKITADVDANSINTGVDQRDAHLKTDDFLNAAAFPNLSLKTIAFKKITSTKYVLLAELTIRNTTKRVTFDVTYGGLLRDPWGLKRAGFSAKATINRLEFGVKYADKLPSGVYAVSPTVEIVINTEIVKQ